MSIVINGVITREMPMQQGKTKNGKDWKRISYVLEYEQGDYPKSIMFDVMNDKIDAMKLKVGERVEVYIDGHVREFGGRFYNNIEAWRCSRSVNFQATSNVSAKAQFPNNPAPSAPVMNDMPEDPQLPF